MLRLISVTFFKTGKAFSNDHIIKKVKVFFWHYYHRKLIFERLIDVDLNVHFSSLKATLQHSDHFAWKFPIKLTENVFCSTILLFITL